MQGERGVPCCAVPPCPEAVRQGTCLEVAQHDGPQVVGREVLDAGAVLLGGVAHGPLARLLDQILHVAPAVALGARHQLGQVRLAQLGAHPAWSRARIGIDAAHSFVWVRKGNDETLRRAGRVSRT